MRVLRDPKPGRTAVPHQDAGYAHSHCLPSSIAIFMRVALASGIALVPGRLLADVPSFVLQALAGQTPNLEILSPTGDARSPLRWATWMTGVQPTSNVVWLALFRRDAKVPSQVWSASHKGGYNPELARIYNWQYDGSPILMFTYQMGAIDKELEMYGLTDTQTPVLLGEYSAGDFLIRYKDRTFLEAYGGLNTPTKCIFFSDERQKPGWGRCPS